MKNIVTFCSVFHLFSFFYCLHFYWMLFHTSVVLSLFTVSTMSGVISSTVCNFTTNRTDTRKTMLSGYRADVSWDGGEHKRAILFLYAEFLGYKRRNLYKMWRTTSTLHMPNLNNLGDFWLGYCQMQPLHWCYVFGFFSYLPGAFICLITLLLQAHIQQSLNSSTDCLWKTILF